MCGFSLALFEWYINCWHRVCSESHSGGRNRHTSAKGKRYFNYVLFRGKELLSNRESALVRPSSKLLLTISRINQYDLIIIKWLFHVLPSKMYYNYCFLVKRVVFKWKIRIYCTLLVALNINFVNFWSDGQFHAKICYLRNCTIKLRNPPSQLLLKSKKEILSCP